MKRPDLWSRLSDDLLDYWFGRAREVYLQDIADPKRNKDGAVPKTTIARIEIGAEIIRMLHRERECRKTRTPPKT